MLKGVAGKTAVVTGAAGGIGSATCRRLSGEGANVVAVDLDNEALGKLVATLPGPAHAVAADVSSRDGTDRFVSAAVATFGSIELFHANAGVECLVRTVADFDASDFDRVFAVNVRGAFLGASAVVRHMADAGGGNILFTASVSALKGDPGVSVYAASKHAVLGLARSLVHEVAPLGIRVNVLCPGPVDTRMMRPLEEGMAAMAGTDAAGLRQSLEAVIPLHRYADPDEAAATAVWLLSDEVPYMHGEVVTVSGGLAP